MNTRRIVNWRSRWHDRHPVYGPISKQTYDAIQMIRGVFELEAVALSTFVPFLANHDREISVGDVVHIPQLNSPGWLAMQNAKQS